METKEEAAWPGPLFSKRNQCTLGIANSISINHSGDHHHHHHHHQATQQHFKLSLQSDETQFQSIVWVIIATNVKEFQTVAPTKSKTMNGCCWLLKQAQIFSSLCTEAREAVVWCQTKVHTTITSRKVHGLSFHYFPQKKGHRCQNTGKGEPFRNNFRNRCHQVV